jgi:hypothetical protein
MIDDRIILKDKYVSYKISRREDIIGIDCLFYAS